VVALFTVVAPMRLKGMLRGALDTALDFIPYVGGVKNTIEAARGRDFFADKVRSTSALRRGFEPALHLRVRDDS